MKKYIGILLLSCLFLAPVQAMCRLPPDLLTQNIRTPLNPGAMEIGESLYVDLKGSPSELLRDANIGMKYDATLFRFDDLKFDNIAHIQFSSIDLGTSGLVKFLATYDYYTGADPFPVATLSFTALSAGHGYFEIQPDSTLDFTVPKIMNDDIGVTVNAAPVPEPGTLILMGTGLAGLLVIRRQSRKNL